VSSGLRILRRVLHGFKHIAYLPGFVKVFAVFKPPLMMMGGYLGFQLSYPFICETRKDSKLHINDRYDLITWIVFLRGEYEVHPGDRVILDCGANIGVFSVYAAAIAPEAIIYAIEPSPQTFQRLLSNLQLNSLEQRVKCLNVELAGQDGRCFMEAEQASQFHHLVAVPDDTSISVTAISLGSLLAQVGIGGADLLKMDIEGAEHAVLKGTPPGVLTGFQRIALEYHQMGSKIDLFKHIEAAGFKSTRDRIFGQDCGVAQFGHRRDQARNRTTPTRVNPGRNTSVARPRGCVFSVAGGASGRRRVACV